MNKEIIYIDIEDDITAIIGKVKTATSKIVALVPPKRIGVLQSAVNLKLLQKAALAEDKRAVLITSDHSLTALAAGIKMPVAKNLQSRPEIPHMESPVSVSEEDVINGQDLPVGEVAAALGGSKTASANSSNDTSGAGSSSTSAKDAAPAAGGAMGAGKPGGLKNKLKIPDFNSFRKRLLIFGGLAIVIIVFLVWAFVFAPRATITVSAHTTNVNIDRTLTLDPSIAESQPEAFMLKPHTQEIKKATAVEFAATGSKEVGDEATGSVTIRNCDNSDGFTLPAGTRFTSANGRVFTSDERVSVPRFTGSANSCSLTGSSAGRASVDVTAVAIGQEYNIPAQGYTFSGSISGSLDAMGSAMTGGSKETVTVVSQEDVNNAREGITPPDVEAAQRELKDQFDDKWLIIEESFAANQADPAVSPNVGEQATNVRLTVETTFSFVAIDRQDVKDILTSAIDDVLESEPDQQMYSLGENSVVFRTFQQESNIYVARMATAGSIGPRIDTEQLAQQLSGKRFGEIQATVEQIPGVSDVDIKLSPFWVTTAPNADKIDIRFSVASRSNNDDNGE